MSGPPPSAPSSLRPPRGPDCLSDLRIDRWLARDLPAPDHAAARAHLAGCPTCAARAAHLEATRDRTASGAAAAWESICRGAAAAGGDHGGGGIIGGEAPSVARRRWWAPPLLAACAAVVVIALFARPRTRPGVDGTGERSKGGARLGFFVKHGDRVRRGGASEVVSAGDSVRFTVSAREPLYVAVLAVDARGVATLFFPADGRMMARLPAGQDVELPSATQLDDAPGAESVHGLFCRDPIDLAQTRVELQARPARLAVPPGCTADHLTWTKARAP